MSEVPATIFEVPVAGAPYDVIVEAGGLARLGALVRERVPHGRAMLIADAALAHSWAPRAEASLAAAGFAVTVAAIEAREEAKVAATVHRLHGALAAARMERGSPVVALGGGIVGDVAGFAAATWLRGVPLVQVPTTLLAMVDAAIGGKTGVNLELPPAAPGGAPSLGKNLVGAFWQPRLVLADPEVLATLPARIHRCGLAEAIKHAIIADAALFADLERDAPGLAPDAVDANARLVAGAGRVKARIVAADEREHGERALLNLGHTFGHAIEALAHDAVLHGEAVAIGTAAVARCAVALGRLAPADAARIEALLVAAGLPVRLDGAVRLGDLEAAMALDKKVRDGRLRLVLPTGIGAATVIAIDDPGPVRDAWRAVGAA